MFASISSRLSACSILAVIFLAGCSNPHALRGRVIQAESPSAQFVDQGRHDPRLVQGVGMAGARIEVVRDPRSLGRKVVASAMSGPDGLFEIRIEAFGAGWMDEEWLFRCTHPNYPMVELFGDLPGADEEYELVFRFGRPGPPGSGGRPIDEQERIRRELDRYGR